MWRTRLLTFAQRFEHPAWGISHAERVYELSLHLADLEGAEVDLDGLFAAAYLHDVGAFEPYKKEGADHAETSVRVMETILSSLGFPSEEVPLVKEIVQGHMFYADPGTRTEAMIFHDADTLDFLGAIGIARLLAIVGLDDWTPDLRSAVELIRRFSQELPDKLVTSHAKEMGTKRQAEMMAFITALASETEGLETL